jgi:hypothetical protein
MNDQPNIICQSRRRSPPAINQFRCARRRTRPARARECRPAAVLADDGELVTLLIYAALRCYAREGRILLLGAYVGNFLLYTSYGRSHGMFLSSVNQNTLFTMFLG